MIRQFTANYHQLHAHLDHTVKAFAGGARRKGFHDEAMLECVDCGVILLYHEAPEAPELEVVPCANCGEEVWDKEPNEHVRTMRIDCQEQRPSLQALSTKGVR